MQAIDKTNFITSELERMLLEGEVPKHLIKEIGKMVEFLKTNNIFKLEQVEGLKHYSVEAKEIYKKARKNYWNSKK